IEFKRDAAREECTETASRRALEADADGVVGKAGMAVALRHFARQHGADSAVDVADRVLDHHWLAAFQRRLRQFDELHIQRALKVMFLFFAMADRNTRL